ncbi:MULTISPECIES: hypothetical protein [Burkholderia]|uniref:hypothetical protein n=1 Tax=Burkholderia TaxID=32008 RepID=UPI000ABA4A98|nr:MULTISPECIES: hypothetical protein [Burkholderia]
MESLNDTDRTTNRKPINSAMVMMGAGSPNSARARDNVAGAAPARFAARDTDTIYRAPERARARTHQPNSRRNRRALQISNRPVDGRDAVIQVEIGFARALLGHMTAKALLPQRPAPILITRPQPRNASIPDPLRTRFAATEVD